MPVSLVLLMAATAALLAISVCAVLRRARGGRPFSDAPGFSKAIPRATDAHAPEIPVHAPLAGSLLTAQLEVDQTFHVQTQTAKYTLTLREPVIGMYDAVRVGPKRGKVVEERFKMLFKGTFVPDQGLRFGEFVPGGNLCYLKIRDAGNLDDKLSTSVIRVLFSIPESYRQAS